MSSALSRPVRRQVWRLSAGMLLLATGLAGVCGTATPAWAQFGAGGGAGGGGAGGGGAGGGGAGGGAAGGAGRGGILIDPQGVLRIDARGAMRTQGGQDALAAERKRAAIARLPGDLQAPSPLRKVALSRLEAELHAQPGRVPEAVERLAGLTRVQYVFVYPAADGQPGDVVLAGPAEPWIEDAAGRVVGTQTGSPTLLLADLAVALRTFAPGHPQDRVIGCSIDPRPEGLAAMQTFLKSLGRVNPQASADQIVAGLAESLGPQKVSVDGVSPATHFAQVLVEADYRMKLIGIGLEPAPVKMTTWIDLASGAAVAANALQRWYFVPDYRCIRIADDDLAIELVGRGVKLCGADEVVLPDGRRMDANRADKASKAFTETFTKKYPEIAARHPVYAQLRNLIDLAVAAAYMQEHDAYGKAGWAAETLRDESRYAIEKYTPPTQVAPAINAVWRGSKLLTPIGGGVTIHPRMALDQPNLIADDKGDVKSARDAAAKLPAGRWWWD